MKKLLVFVCVLVFALFVCGCGETPATTIDGIAITSEGNVRTIKVGETLQLVAKVFPETADQSVLWASSKAEVATVSENGLVTAVSEGNVDIKATSKVDETISQSFSLIIEKAAEVVIEPTSVTITAQDNITTCKAGEKIYLTATVLPAEANQSVTWTSENSEIATVSRGEVSTLKEGTVVITANAKGYDNVKASITLTVEKGEGPAQTHDWATMEYSTHTDFVESEANTPLKVKGVVTHVAPVNNGFVNYFIQNGTDGFYVYNQDATAFPVELGKTYEVGGFKKYYRGLNEIVNVELFKELAEAATYTVNNINDKDATSLSEMTPFHCSLVSGKAEFDSAEVNDSKAYSFYALVNGKSATFRVDPAYMTAEEFAAVNKIVKVAVKGMKFDFTGLMTAFGYGAATPQIQIKNSNEIKFEELSDKDLLKAASEGLSISSSIALGVDTIELPKLIEGFDGLTISWSSNSDAINVETGAVAHKDSNVTVTLTAKFTKGSETLEKTFEVLVFAADNKEYQVLASFDCEDAEAADKNGNSTSKGSYAEATVELGTPKHTWLLKNALIACIANDVYDGTFGIRAKAGKSADATARIEIQHDDEYNVVEFATAVYGNDKAGIQLKIEYSTDKGTTWVAAEGVITVESRTLQTYRVTLPEGVKRVAIVVVENSGNRVNIDNIKLMK